MAIKSIFKLIFDTNFQKLFLAYLILLNIIAQAAGYFFGDRNGIIESYNISNLIYFSTKCLFYFIIIIFFLNKINNGNKKHRALLIITFINLLTFLFFSEYLLIVSSIIFYFTFFFVAFISKKKNETLWVINVNILFLLFLFTIVELIFSLVLKHPEYYDDYAYRKSKPNAYLKSEYFSKNFLNESYGLDYFDLKHDSTNSLLLTFPKNRTGRWINVENNVRVTTNNPKIFNQSIYLYGGSSVFCREVPDSLTIASILQRKINKLNYKVLVRNHGIPGADIREQLERLKYDDLLNEKDIVIFIDGVNDITRGVYYGMLTGPVPGFNHPNSSYFINQLEKLYNFSYLFKFLKYRLISNFKSKQDNLTDTVNQYVESIQKTDEYVKLKKGNFFHYLQPNLFSKKIKSDYELFLLKREKNLRKGLDLVFEKSIPKVADRIDKFNFSQSMINIFDSMDLSPYLDYCHVNEYGNEVIASLIMEDIINVLKKDEILLHID